MSMHYLILGFGLTGKAVFNFLIKHHAIENIVITVFDEKITEINNLLSTFNNNITVNLIHSILDIPTHSKIDLAIASPGINPRIYYDFLVNILNVRVISDIQLFVDAIHNKTEQNYIYSITGTNGKSTVCSLLHFLLDKNKKLDNKVSLGGNFGVPAVDLVKQENINHNVNNVIHEYVLELSSYQLELTDKLYSLAAVCLNITPDHLVWHNGMINYINAKLRVYNNSTFDIVNADDQLLLSKYISLVLPKKNKLGHLILYSNISTYSELYQNLLNFDVSLKDVNYSLITIESYQNKSYICINQEQIIAVDLLPFMLRTKHNLSNLLAVIGMLLAKYSIFDLSSSVKEFLLAYLQHAKDFQGLPYRCEFVLDYKSIKVFNDSKATNLNATVTALESMTQAVEHKLWLILGGVVKEDIDIAESRQEFITCLKNNLSKIAGIAICSNDKTSQDKFIDLIQNANLTNSIELLLINQFAELIPVIFNKAKSGDYLLFSPGGASFDNFSNYLERGAKFNECVEQYVVSQHNLQ